MGARVWYQGGEDCVREREREEGEIGESEGEGGQSVNEIRSVTVELGINRHK